VRGIQAAVGDDGLISSGEVFGNKIFRNIVLSLVATYGLYIISSLLALDPWHMGKVVSLKAIARLTSSDKFPAVYVGELLRFTLTLLTFSLHHHTSTL